MDTQMIAFEEISLENLLIDDACPDVNIAVFRYNDHRFVIILKYPKVSELK